MRITASIAVASALLVALASSSRLALAGDDVAARGRAPATKIALPDDFLACAAPVSSGPCAPPCAPVRSVCGSRWDGYVPVIPVGPSRTMYTTPVMPPTPWLLTQGEAATPRCGRLGFNIVRISDERAFTDNLGNRYEFDGEEQVLMLEWVSPRIESDVGGCCVPFHLAASLSAHTNNFAWFEGLRNFVENDLLNAEQDVRDSHGIGGREDSITDPLGDRTNLLDTVEPLLKAQFVMKFPLPDRPVGCHRLESALSLGFGAPAFGTKADSGNAQFQFDLSLAAALPLSESFRLTGVANLAVPGRSETLEEFGLDHHDLVPGGVMSVEWWASQKFAVSLGFTVNGPYTKDSGLPTDLTSFYANLGLLWRVSPRWELHAMFSENPGGLIAVNGTPATDYTWDTQRDADFSVTIGTTVTF